MDNYNYLAHCISDSCEKYESCARAKSEKYKVDYIRINPEEDCKYYIEIKNEIEDTTHENNE